MPAELSGWLDLEDVIARLPHLTIHLVDMPDRLWVVDLPTLTIWVHKGSTSGWRDLWVREATEAIARARTDLGAEVPVGVGVRLRSVPSA